MSCDSESQLDRASFPIFARDGDVEIILSSETGSTHRRYILHRHILRRYSNLLLRSDHTPETSNSPAGLQVSFWQKTTGATDLVESQHRPFHTIQSQDWNHHALERASNVDLEVSRLVREDFRLLNLTSDSSRPSPDYDGPPPTLELGSKPTASTISMPHYHRVGSANLVISINAASVPGDDVFTDYDNMFRIFYDLPPTLSTTNIATAYVACKALLHLAKTWGALDVVRPRVDLHLQTFGDRLFRQIAKYPPSYLKLGLLARSKIVFTEAFVHVVGQWPQARPQLSDELPPGVLRLIEDRRAVLLEDIAGVEAKLLRLNARTKSDEQCLPKNDFIGWLATCLFRQWIVDNVSPTSISSATMAKAHHDGPASALDLSAAEQVHSTVFHIIGSRHRQSYLNHDDIKLFLKLSTVHGLYDKTVISRLELRLNSIKSQARRLVQPLITSSLQMKHIGSRCSTSSHYSVDYASRKHERVVGYLTCTRLTDDDLPWSS